MTCPSCDSRGAFEVSPKMQIVCKACRTVHIPAEIEKSQRWIRATSFKPAEVSGLFAGCSQSRMTRLGKETIVSSKYRLEYMIGQGGMGTVFLAVDKDTDERIALKIIHKAYCSNTEFIKRFLREATILKSVRHRNLIRFLDLGIEEDGYFLVMTFADGMNLKDLVQKSPPLPVRTAMKIIAQTGMGLLEAHKNCIVHRDIKPENVVLARDGSVKIIDFGLAKNIISVTSNVTVSGQVLGTPAYMAPERCDGAHGDNRCDIYSLGATLYFALTGQQPFQGANNWAIMLKHLNDPVPDVRTLNPAAGKPCADIISMMMAKKPEARYQTMEAVVEDLCRVLLDEKPALSPLGDDTVLSTRAAEETTSESTFEKALRIQDDLRSQGKYVPPIGELVAISDVPIRVVRSFAGSAVVRKCLCGKALTLKTPDMRCPACGSPVRVDNLGKLTKLDRFVRIESPRRKLTYGDSRFEDAFDGILSNLVEIGESSIVLDMPNLEDFSHDQFIWIFSAFEVLASAGGSLSLIVGNERVRSRFAAVGADKFIRLFDSPESFKKNLLTEEAKEFYSIADRRPELWKAVKASRDSDPLKAIELYDGMIAESGLEEDPEERDYFVNYIASQMTAKVARAIAGRKYVIAKILLRKMLGAFPDYPPALLYKGQMHLAQKEYREAAECFNGALEANPDFVPALEGRGSANYYQNLQEKAMEDFTRELELNPQSDVACYNIACVYAAKDENTTALHWLRKAVGLGFADSEHIAGDPDLSSISSLPEFAEIIEKLRFAEKEKAGKTESEENSPA